jgi:hypothetical protein
MDDFVYKQGKICRQEWGGFLSLIQEQLQNVVSITGMWHDRFQMCMCYFVSQSMQTPYCLNYPKWTCWLIIKELRISGLRLTQPNVDVLLSNLYLMMSQNFVNVEYTTPSFSEMKSSKYIFLYISYEINQVQVISGSCSLIYIPHISTYCMKNNAPLVTRKTN